MKNPKVIEKESEGNLWSWKLPTYVIDNEGIKDGEGVIINLCRGNKADETAPRQEGVFTESVLQMAKEYLEGVNKGELATRETSMAITKIDEALLWIGKRAEDRKLREVQGTYSK